MAWGYSGSSEARIFLLYEVGADWCKGTFLAGGGAF